MAIEPSSKVSRVLAVSEGPLWPGWSSPTLARLTMGAPTRNRARSMRWQASPTSRPPPSAWSWVQWLAGMAPAFMVRVRALGPERVASSSAMRWETGANRRLKPTPTSGTATPDAVRSSMHERSEASCSASMATGFSTKTCLPARSARST